jgi:hypothetical protein
VKVIVGDSINEIDDEVKTHLETKYVWFNHFLPLYYVPDASTFQKIARRRAATVCKPGQNGIDHEIPLMDENCRKVVGTLAIQTKNVARKHDSDYPASAGWKMSREFALHGSDRDGAKNAGDFYFALYHNIGYQRPKSKDGTKSFECNPMKSATDVFEWKSENKKCFPPKGLEIVGLDLPLFESLTNQEHHKNLNAIQSSLKQLCDQGRNPIAHFNNDLKAKMQELAPLAYKEND